MSHEIDLREAWRCIEEHVQALGSEIVPLDAARGRVLRATLRVDRDAPAFDRAAMDGFAVCCTDLASARDPAVLQVVGEATPGSSGPVKERSGTAIRIMTGAAVPAGWDAIVPVEETPGFAATSIAVAKRPRPGQNVVRRGAERAAGDVLLLPGRRLSAADTGALAMVGVASVEVGRRARVAILATGTELVAHTATPGPLQIRNSNTPMLQALAQPVEGLEVLSVARDDEHELSTRVAEGLAWDLFLVTGGNSMGAYDLVSQTLERAGVRIHFDRVSLQPGKPTSFGTHGRGCVLALPGNPVSAFTTFRLFGSRVLACLEGEIGAWPGWTRGRARFEWRRRNSKWVVLPGRSREEGAAVELVPYAGSGDLLAYAGADCQIVLPPEVDRVASDDEVIVWAIK